VPLNHTQIAKAGASYALVCAHMQTASIPSGVPATVDRFGVMLENGLPRQVAGQRDRPVPPDRISIPWLMGSGSAAGASGRPKFGAPLKPDEKLNDFNCHKSFAPLRLMGPATRSQGLGMASWPIILNRRGPNAEYGF